MNDKHIPNDHNDQDAMILHGPDNKIWYVVAEVAGITNAEIVAGLLRTSAIPVYLYREAAGSSALPVQVGLLGTVYVAVPEAHYAEALALLDQDDGPFPELPAKADSPDEEA